MILFRNIHSAFQPWPLFAGVMMIAAIAASAPASAEQPAAQPPTTVAPCPQPEGEPASSTYTNVTGVALDIQIEPRFVQALDCHGHEQQCIGKYASESRDPAYIKRLKDTYNRYPHQLEPDNLIALFRPLIEQRLLPYVVHAGRCPGHDIKVFKVFSPLPLPEESEVPKAMTAHYNAIHNATTLTVTVKVDIFDDAKPRIAVLSSSPFKQNMDFSDSRVVVQAIPLDISDDEFTKLLTSYASQAVPKVGVRENELDSGRRESGQP